MKYIAAKLWLILFLLLNSKSVFAREVYEFYNGIRQMSMGGVSIAVVNDETALLANPAGLGKLRDTFTTLIDPEVDYGQLNSSIAPGTSITETLTMQGLIDLLRSAKDTHFHLRTQIFPSFVLTNFGVGFFAKYATDAEMASGSPDTLHFDYVNDIAFVMGYCFRIWDGRIKFGFNVKYVNRLEIRDQDPAIPSTVTGAAIKDYASEGGGISSDGGVIFTLPWTLLPTLAVMVHDIGNTAFNAASGLVYNVASTQPDIVPQTIDAAFALFPIVGNRTRVTFSGEYRDVTNVLEETDTSRKMHVGMEFNFSDMFFFRLGMNQRYWTAGVEFAYDRFQFQLGSYGEDIGTSSANREDRRYSAKFAYRF